MTSVRVTVSGDDPYDVVIGHGVAQTLPRLLGPDVGKVLLVHPAAVAGHASTIGQCLRDAGLDTVVALVPDGEDAKTLDVVGGLWSTLGGHAFTRTDAVVAVGGGSTTDLAGFAAASWLRGVSWVAVPTTLLGMVDAAIGGKTGLNTAEGKNLVGAFHAPAGVICDLEMLSTLSRADMASGMAEVVKVGLVADPTILDLVERTGERALDAGGDVMPELVRRAVAVKASVVAADYREAGPREVLNYGHTLGHAIERVESYRWRHGDAVSVGLVFAAELAHEVGRLDPPGVARHRSALTTLGLPTSYLRSRWSEVMAAMRVDKKARGATLRFVVLDDIGVPGRLDGPDEALLERVFEKVAT